MKNKKLGRTENLNEIILNSVNEYIRVVDRKYNVVFENTPMQEQLGKTKGINALNSGEKKNPAKTVFLLRFARTAQRGSEKLKLTTNISR